jgi:hypothetical protein
MGGLTFAVPLTLGAALIAVWVDCLLGARRPATLLRRFLHTVVAFAVLQAATAVAGHVAGGESRGEDMLAIFLLLLPSLVYAFLGGAWLIRTLAEATRFAGR